MPVTKIRYEYWQHKVSRERYAVRLAATQVTGVVGPLAVNSAADFIALPHYAYDEDPGRIEWIQERGGEFLLSG